MILAGSPGDWRSEQDPAYSPLWVRVRSQTPGEEAQATPLALQATKPRRGRPNGRSRQPEYRRRRQDPRMPEAPREIATGRARVVGGDPTKFRRAQPGRRLGIRPEPPSPRRLVSLLRPSTQSGVQSPRSTASRPTPPTAFPRQRTAPQPAQSEEPHRPAP